LPRDRWSGGDVSHGTPLLSGAQLADQLEPIRRLRDELGLPMKVAINHDINGLPWTATQLLLDAGVELLLMGINVHLGGYPMHRPLPSTGRAQTGASFSPSMGNIIIPSTSNWD